jgi:hypothetical protein
MKRNAALLHHTEEAYRSRFSLFTAGEAGKSEQKIILRKMSRFAIAFTLY